MSKYLNFLRYVFSLALPVFCIGDPVVLFDVLFLLLLFNNCIDDLMFYYGNSSIDRNVYKGGTPSPVNGIVTLVEKGVPLYDSIRKIDPLTYEKYLSLDMSADTMSKYDHVAIFLNKFSHHIVINPRRLITCKAHLSDGTLKAMVEDGQLLSDNIGEYMNNDSLILRYPDCVVVLTLDKFVSDYMFVGGNAFEPSVSILRGSQCDIYTKHDAVVKVNDKVEVFQSIAHGDYCRLHDIDDKINETIGKSIERAGGVSTIIKSNIMKTASTFAGFKCIPVVVGVLAYLFITPLSYVAFLWTYYFVMLRFLKHFLYTLMNIVGYSGWMGRIYSIANKPMQLWQRK